MRRAVTAVLCGTLLIWFDLRINRFDLLPDLAGAIAVAVGVYALRRADEDATFRTRVNVALAFACALVAAMVVDVGPLVGHAIEGGTPIAIAATLMRLGEVRGLPNVVRASRRALLWSVPAAGAWLVAPAVAHTPLLAVVVVLALGAAITYVVALVVASTTSGAPAADPGEHPGPRPDGGTMRTVAALTVVVTVLIGGWSAVSTARAQNFGRAYDPYRASAVRAGMLDWPIRGNRTHDRGWMHDHIYCCSEARYSRVLYAEQTDQGALTIVESPERDQRDLTLGAAGTGLWAHDVAIGDRPEQVSAIVPLHDGGQVSAQILVVVGRPGTTRVRWRMARSAIETGRDIELHDGAGWAELPHSTGQHPNDFVITVERDGHVVYDGTVTTLAGQGLSYFNEAPAPLTTLPDALTATAGEDADHVAFRFCLGSAYDVLAGTRTADERHYGELAHDLADLARDPAVRAAGRSGVRAALAQPGSALARAATKTCRDYNAMGAW